MEKNTTAIVGSVLSIVGFVFLIVIIIVFSFLHIENNVLGNFLCLGMIGGVIGGLSCSIIGLKKSKKSRKFAIVGIVFSAIPIVALIISIPYVIYELLTTMRNLS